MDWSVHSNICEENLQIAWEVATFIVTANPYGLIRFTVTYTISKKALLILRFTGQDLIDMKLCELKMCVTKLILSIQDVVLRRKGLTNVCYKNE